MHWVWSITFIASILLGGGSGGCGFTVVSSALIYTRNQHTLFSLDSTTGYLKTLQSIQEAPFTLNADAFDELTQTAVAGKLNPPIILLYNSSTSRYINITRSTGPSQLISYTAFNGTIYAIYTRNSVAQITMATFNLVGGGNTSFDIDSTYTFCYSYPLLFYNPNGTLLIEVADNKLKRQIIALRTFSSLTSISPLISGSSRLWYDDACPNTIFAFQKGVFLAIQNLTIYTILSIPCDINAFLTINFNQSLIYTADLCQPKNLRLRSWDFKGNVLGSVSVVWDTSQPMTGFQFAAPNLAGLSRSCPWSPPMPIPPISPTVQFWGSTNSYLIVGLGVFAVICVAVIVFCAVNLRGGQDGYSQVPTASTETSDGTVRLHEALTASGGKIEVEEIQTQELIGQGSFANVFRGIYHETEVAIKVVKVVSMEEMEKSLLEEASLMVKLRHPSIVLFMGACIKYPDLFIVTEFMANGSVREILDKKDEVHLEIEHIRKMSIDACKGMAFLHSKKIIHRDLKTHNLLVDKMWNVKVADFGLSRAMGDVDGTMTACGTPSWAAPEVLRRDHYSTKADVYSFGICMWEMTTRKRPYSQLKPYQVVISVATDNLRPEVDSSIPPYFEKLMKHCWSDQPEERPDFPHLKEQLEELQCPSPRHPYPVFMKREYSMPSDASSLVEINRDNSQKGNKQNKS